MSDNTEPLQQRLAAALGTHDVHPDDRMTIQRAYVDAGMDAAAWEDLPADIRALVERIENSERQSWEDPAYVPDDLPDLTTRYAKGPRTQRGPFAYTANAKRAASAKRFDPGQPRNEDGEWSKVPGGALHTAGDKLNLAGRIPLEPGEHLAASGVVTTEDSVMPMAWVDTPAGTTLRIGTGIRHEDKGRWRGANRGSTVVLDEEGASRLASATKEMLEAGAAGVDREEELSARQDELEHRQRDLIRRQYPSLTRQQAKELDRLDEKIEGLASHIDRIEAQNRDSFEDLSPQTQDTWRRLDNDMRQLAVERDAITADYWANGGKDPALLDQKKTLDFRIEDLLEEQSNLHNEREPDRGRVGYASFYRQRRDKLHHLRRDLGIANDRRAELTAETVPLSATDAADLATTTAELRQTTDELWAFIDEGDLASGAVTGEWGDLAYQAVMTDTGVRYRIAVRPHDAPADWYPGQDETDTTLTADELGHLADTLSAGAPTVGKADDGAAGRHRARHLIRWFNAGADGQIPWGAPGDLTACHAVASKHMTSQQAWGYCNERHKDVLGTYNDPND